MHVAMSSTAAAGRQHPAEGANLTAAAENVIDAVAAPQPAVTAAERIREAFVQPDVMLDGLLAMVGEPSGASAAHDHIASGIASALAAQHVPTSLAALCAATFPGVIGIRYENTCVISCQVHLQMAALLLAVWLCLEVWPSVVPTAQHQG
jgi:hypothetical protein